MEIGMQECKQCIGIDNCNKYCAKKAGKTLADYIINIDKVETEIGELRKPIRVGDPTLIIIGHILAGDVPTFVMRELTSDIKINSNSKFKTFKGKNVIGVLKAYTNTLDQQMYKDRIAEANSILKNINSNKTMVLPIKLSTKVNVETEDAAGHKKAMHGIINALTWRINKDTGKLDTKVSVTLGNTFNSKKTLNVDLGEYGDEFIIENIVSTLKTAEIQTELIKLNNEGMIRPIIIKDKTMCIGVDCRHLYMINDNETIVIGKWTEKGLDEFGVTKSIKNTKAYKKFNEAMRYVESHKKYIAPLGLIEENIVEGVK